VAAVAPVMLVQATTGAMATVAAPGLLTAAIACAPVDSVRALVAESMAVGDDQRPATVTADGWSKLVQLVLYPPGRHDEACHAPSHVSAWLVPASVAESRGRYHRGAGTSSNVSVSHASTTLSAKCRRHVLANHRDDTCVA